MKKTIFYIVLVFALLTKCVSAQYITNYNLGKGYTYFKSVNKSTFLADLGFANNGGSYAESKMTGNPFYLMNIAKEQENDKSSLLNILRQRNPDVAKKYEAQLDNISEICNSGEKLGVSYYKRIFPDPRENPELYYKCVVTLTKVLEANSDYYRDIENVNTKMEIEQNVLNETYKKTTDSIINIQKLKFVNEKELYTDQFAIAKQDSDKFQKKLNSITKPIQVKYSAAIDLLKREKKAKINQLSQTNFINNKAAIESKYGKLIDAKVSQGNEEIKNVYSKFLFDNEQAMGEYDKKLKALSTKINDLNNKIDDVSNNLDATLPPRPAVNTEKFQEKLNKLEDEKKQKLSSIKF